MNAIFPAIQGHSTTFLCLSAIVILSCNNSILVIVATQIAVSILTRALDPDGARTKRSSFKRFFTIEVPDNIVYSLARVLSVVPDLREWKDPSMFAAILLVTAISCKALDVGRQAIAAGLDWLFPSVFNKMTCFMGFHPLGPRDYYASPAEEPKIDNTWLPIKVSHTSLPFFIELTAKRAPNHCSAWKAWQGQVIQRHLKDLIPEKYADDPILNENICPLTQSPIRFPCRTPLGHVFEEAALCSWMVNQFRHNVVPLTCPITGIPLNPETVERDKDLRDKIKARLMLLKANHGSI